jgi:import inner membrane translocase subunit TIM10
MSSQPESVPGMTQAKYELMGFTGLFNSMTNACFNSCVSRFKDKETTLGEVTCVDRCVVKYMQTQGEVGKVISAKNAEGMAQQQQAQ